MNEEVQQIEHISLVDQATQAAERLEKANIELKELIKKQETLMANKILAGRSEAGSTPIQVTPEQRTKDELRAFFKGTALERNFQ